MTRLIEAALLLCIAGIALVVLGFVAQLVLAFLATPSLSDWPVVFAALVAATASGLAIALALSERRTN